MRFISLTLAVGLLCACGTAPSAGGPPAASTSPASAPASPAALSCTAAGNASLSWPKPEAPSGAPAIVSASVAGDTLKLTFVAGTPGFQVIPQPTARFTADPSGRPIDLPGTAGVRIVLRGFRGDTSNYSGESNLASSGPLLLQASKIGDFEGVVSFGAGTSAPACASVTGDESSLTFRFIPAP